jgi:serine/threonine-protein kinase
VHRDVKPANVFVCRRGTDVDVVKVLDFGLAKDLVPAAKESAHLTRDGATTGTPGFMAPEVVAGRPLDSRADIYALGCLAFWLLTGRLVFEGDNAVAIMAKHLGEEPSPPSAFCEWPVPQELDRVVLDCLAKDPERRPRTARELAARLRDHDGERPAWSAERAEQWWTANLPQAGV